MALRVHAPIEADVDFSATADFGASHMVAIDCACGDYAGHLVETREVAMELWERHFKLATSMWPEVMDLGPLRKGGSV